MLRYSSVATDVDALAFDLLALRAYYGCPSFGGVHIGNNGEIPFRAVAQMVGFDLGRSKMLDLSMGID